ncbi:MAG TPA: hypothetical protein VMY42_24855, partial [Thermoguttaceae bacterium]|nr:hypothetical protein [Thermoguttaceae bacterium]
MTPNEKQWDEKRLAALFAAVDADAPPPDEEFLDRLAGQSAEAFQAGASPQTQLPTRRRRMFVLALRTLAATAAAAAVAIACFWSSLFKDDSAVAFENVLEKVA